MAPLRIATLERPFDATVTVPGSKSLTNRALLCAALSSGSSTITNVLAADDTEAMIDVIGALGASVTRSKEAIAVRGAAGALVTTGSLNARQSGTTARFIAPVIAVTPGPWRLDGDAQLRKRPMRDLFEALRHLGATVASEGGAESLPAVIRGPISGGAVVVSGETTSQFLSGLLFAGPLVPTGLEVRVTGALVSRPFVEMSADMMRRFGATVEASDGVYRVGEGGYRAADVVVEPDATSASYLFAAAALTRGGRVVVREIGRRSLQGDLAFVGLLEEMGASVTIGANETEVRGTGVLHGIDVSCRDMPDIVPTLAVVAAFADGPTTIRDVGFIRGMESDRIGGLVAQLRALGVGAEERPDGLVIVPGPLRVGLVTTSGDHRMAMAFAVMGLRAPGIVIDDPECVAKTFPDFFAVLAGLSG